MVIAKAAMMKIKDGSVVMKHIAFPGMGTGVGNVPAELCAKQMRRAYDEVFGTCDDAKDTSTVSNHDTSNCQSTTTSK